VDQVDISGEAVTGQTLSGSSVGTSEGWKATLVLRPRPCQSIVSTEDSHSNRTRKSAHSRTAELHRDRAVQVTDPRSFTATFLVVDVRGWSKIVHDLGPDPRPAGQVIQRFWDSSLPVVGESGGQVYAWRGDGILAAYQGDQRLERALKAAECLLAVVRKELAPGFRAQLRAANARTIDFAVSTAITDGEAVAVPVRFGAQHSEELTGDWVNAAFGMVKWAMAGTVGTTWEISRWLEKNSPASLRAFTWNEPEEVLLAGAVRRVLQGIPATAGSGRPGSDPRSPGD
jgi:class 3 adenylate cyclase